MSQVVRARTTWMKCERWLAVTPDPRIQNEDMTQVFNDVRTFDALERDVKKVEAAIEAR